MPEDTFLLCQIQKATVEGLLPAFGIGVTKGVTTINNGGVYSINIFKSGDKQAKLLGTDSSTNLVSFMLALTGEGSIGLILVTLQGNKISTQSFKSGNAVWSLSLKNNTIFVSSKYSSAILKAIIYPINVEERYIYAVESSEDLTNPDFKIEV